MAGPCRKRVRPLSDYMMYYAIWPTLQMTANGVSGLILLCSKIIQRHKIVCKTKPTRVNMRDSTTTHLHQVSLVYHIVQNLQRVLLSTLCKREV